MGPKFALSSRLLKYDDQLSKRIFCEDQEEEENVSIVVIPFHQV